MSATGDDAKRVDELRAGLEAGARLLERLESLTAKALDTAEGMLESGDDRVRLEAAKALVKMRSEIAKSERSGAWWSESTEAQAARGDVLKAQRAELEERLRPADLEEKQEDPAALAAAARGKTGEVE